MRLVALPLFGTSADLLMSWHRHPQHDDGLRPVRHRPRPPAALHRQRRRLAGAFLPSLVSKQTRRLTPSPAPSDSPTRNARRSGRTGSRTSRTASTSPRNTLPTSTCRRPRTRSSSSSRRDASCSSRWQSSRWAGTSPSPTCRPSRSRRAASVRLLFPRCPATSRAVTDRSYLLL